MITGISTLLGEIEKQGWSVQKNFFPLELIQALHKTLSSLHQQGQLQQAGIGRKNNFQVKKTIRSDQINWFDEDKLSESQQAYLFILGDLQAAFNQQLYFGLSDFEVHFALYAPNAYYSRHLDQHRNQDTRVLTVITYLNENWQEDDGGELVLYFSGGEKKRVMPEAGTMVCFLSAEFEHEVLPAKRERASLTGWFRKRA